MGKIQVFLDTNVIISSLISKTGASYQIIRNNDIKKIISQGVLEEVSIVTKRHDLDTKKIHGIVSQLNCASITISKNKITKTYSKYVSDEKDSHIIGATHKTETKFLITHNIKHFDSDKINSDLGVIVLKPGNFLQYLRSQKNEA